MRYEPAVINVSGCCKLICVMGSPCLCSQQNRRFLTLSLPAVLQALIPAFSAFFFLKLHSLPRSHGSQHENPSFVNTLIFSNRNYRSLSPLFCHLKNLFLLPPHSRARPRSILSSLALCVTPTQGFGRRMV